MFIDFFHNVVNDKVDLIIHREYDTRPNDYASSWEVLYLKLPLCKKKGVQACLSWIPRRFLMESECL